MVRYFTGVVCHKFCIDYNIFIGLTSDSIFDTVHIYSFELTTCALLWREQKVKLLV